MKLKNLTAIALTGMVCLSACTPQYTVEGKWADGAGKTVYLQKKVNDETPVIDSVVVAADGSFSFTLPAGVDVYELNAAKEAKKEILVSEIPVVVTIATELRTAKDSSTYETLSIGARYADDYDRFFHATGAYVCLIEHLTGKRYDDDSGFGRRILRYDGCQNE